MANTGEAAAGGTSAGAGAGAAKPAGGGSKAKTKLIVPVGVTLESIGEKGERVLHEAGKPVKWDAGEAEELIKAGFAEEFKKPAVPDEEK